MSDYTKSTDFASKDSLPSGNSGKIVKGTEIDTEFNNIAAAVATKADLTSPTFGGSPSLPSGTTGVTQSSSDDSTKLATTAFVQDIAAAVKEALYPVGSVYTNSSVSTNPGTLLGFGTWSAFGAGKFLVSLDGSDTSFDTAGETGGSKDAIAVAHTHSFSATTSTDGAHTHTCDMGNGETGGGHFTDSGDYDRDHNIPGTAGSHSHTISGTTGSTGSSGTNANLPPYIVVYMWERTA